MNNAKIMIEMDKLSRQRTNNILHLLLSVVTAGLWLPVWLLIAVNNAVERGRIERRIDKYHQSDTGC